MTKLDQLAARAMSGLCHKLMFGLEAKALLNRLATALGLTEHEVSYTTGAACTAGEAMLRDPRLFVWVWRNSKTGDVSVYVSAARGKQLAGLPNQHLHAANLYDTEGLARTVRTLWDTADHPQPLAA